MARPILLVALLAAAFVRPAAAQVVQTLGRRIAITGTVLALTEPDLDRIALYDVSGARPRKIGAFGRTGFRAGELRGPHGATLDAGGRLYVSDTFNNRIQAFDVTGLARGRTPRLVSAFGTFGTVPGDLRAPHDPVALSSRPGLRGRVFVVDSRNDRVQSFDARGQPVGPMIGGRGAEEGKLADPAGAAFDPRGRVLYVAEAGNRRVSAFDATTGAFLFAFAREVESPGGIAVDAAGMVYVADVGARLVRRYTPVRGPAGLVRAMRPAPAWSHAGNGPGPQAIAVDARGRVYTVSADDRGQVFSATGAALGSFGEDIEPVVPAAAPPPPERLAGAFCSAGGTYGIEILKAPDPMPLGDLFDLEVQVRAGCRSRRSAEGIALEVDATMPGHGHGMNTHPRVAPLGPGRFLVTGLRFHMPGRWEIVFDVVKGGALERAQTEVGLE